MKKEDFLKLGLTEEQATKAAEASAEELKGFIPKSRFDEVNEAKKQLEADIKTRDTQLEELKKIDAAGLKAQIEKLQTENKAAKEAFDAQVKQLKIDGIVERALTTAKAKNVIAAKALLADFLAKAELDGEDKIKGLDDAIKKLTESEETKFLFEIATTMKNKPTFTGLKPAEKTDGANDGNKSLTLADAVAAALGAKTQ